MKFQYMLGVAFFLSASCGPQGQSNESVDTNNSATLAKPTTPATATNQEGSPASAAAPAPAPKPAPVRTPGPAPALAPAPVPVAGPGQPDRTSLPEPKGPIDFKSVEAAGQIVQHYGALIEGKRWTAAAALWGSREQAEKFAAALKGDRENHLEIGALGESEGAAGSIYVSMPVTLYGKDAGGKTFRSRQTIVLRRVNDVPGSTDAQRHWHILRIDAPAP